MRMSVGLKKQNVQAKKVHWQCEQLSKLLQARHLH